MKKSTLLSLLILMSNTGAMANVLHVTTGKDSVPGSLRSVVSEAQSGDTIEIDENVPLLTLDEGEIVIQKNLTLQGMNKTSRPVVDAQNKSRIFMIHGLNLNVNISNMNFTHGNSNKATLTNYPAGGAINILSEGSRIGITNVDFYENNSMSHGGAIEATGPAAPHYSMLTLNHVNFHDNRSLHGGAALFHWGTSVKATDTVFEHNTSLEGDGAIWSSTGCLDLNHVSITENQSQIQSGINSSSFMKLVDVLVDHNTSVENAAAVEGGFILKMQDSQIQSLAKPLSLRSEGNNVIGEFTPSRNKPLSSVVFHPSDKVGNTEKVTSLNVNVPHQPTYGPCVWEMMN
ncbi:hypothetical protein ACNQKP_12645 [Bdellovibrio bacteriovorus]|uniref:hypothetical protein n=1 Tax=Bdellovibrio bacteriovorus TaxID=959 RepID=UPI003AA98142